MAVPRPGFLLEAGRDSEKAGGVTLRNSGQEAAPTERFARMAEFSVMLNLSRTLKAKGATPKKATPRWTRKASATSGIMVGRRTLGRRVEGLVEGLEDEDKGEDDHEDGGDPSDQVEEETVGVFAHEIFAVDEEKMKMMTMGSQTPLPTWEKMKIFQRGAFGSMTMPAPTTMRMV